MYIKLKKIIKILHKKIKNFGEPEVPDFFFFLLLNIITGFLTGVILVIFSVLISYLKSFFFEQKLFLYNLHNFFIYLISPAIGGLIVGIIIKYIAEEVKASGIPQIISISEIGNSQIRGRVIWSKILASSFTLGSGGSAGRIGPIVQTGAAVGSYISQKFHLNQYQRKILLASGATAAISSIFSAPFAAVVFSFEFLLRELKTISFIPLVAGSISGLSGFKLVSKIIGITQKPIFQIPSIHNININSIETLLFPLLGILTGFISIGFIKIYKITSKFFKDLKINDILKPALGGLIIGIIAATSFLISNIPIVLGTGYNIINTILNGSYPVLYLLIFIILKMIATAITIGSNGAGGFFAPALFVGSLIGLVFGIVIKTIFPSWINDIYIYAFAGMGAFYAGISRATLTAIIVIFEISGNYSIIIPLMLACVSSDLIASIFFKDSIYTYFLKENGILIDFDIDSNVMKQIPLTEIINRNFYVEIDFIVKSILNKYKNNEYYYLLEKIMLFAQKNRKDYVPVIKDNKPFGFILYYTVIELMRHYTNREINESSLSLIINENIETINIKNTAEDAIVKFRNENIKFLFIVNEKGEFEGIIERDSIINAYRKKRIAKILKEKRAKLTLRKKLKFKFK